MHKRHPVCRTFLLTAAVCFSASLRAGTVGHWTFGGTPGQTAASLPAVAGAPAAAAARAGAGSAPVFDGGIPCAHVWDGVSGEPANTENTASLRFANAGLPDNPNSGDGGCATVPDSALPRLTDLTVETFVKVDRRVNWPLIVGKRRADGNGTSWNLDMDNAGRPRVRIDSQPLGSSSGGGWNQSWTAQVSVEDGEWHHLALTYSHAGRAVKLYVDHVLRASGNSFSNLVYDSNSLFIGQGAGGRAFDGWIDEVRISDEVLSPERFLTASAPSEVAGHWSFESETPGAAADVLASSSHAPFMHGTAATVSGGAKPVFAAETPPGTTRRVSSGEGGPTANADNRGSLRFTNTGLPGDPASKSGGQITVPGTSLLAQPASLTAEAFVRVDRAGVTYPQIIGKARAATGGLSWSMALNESGCLRARFDTEAPPSKDGFNQVFDSTARADDGMWHHAALTYDAETRAVRLYLDYAEVRAGELSGPLRYDGGNIQIGSGDKAFDGWIDEARITGRAMGPAEFLRTVPDVGSVTGVR